MPTTPRTGGRSGATARNEVIEMLKADHKRAKKSFREFEKLDPEQDADECLAIVRQTCAELTLHATLEEQAFYPAARSALGEPELIDEAEVEHATAKQLIAQLQQMSPSDAKYGATFKVLGEYITHHIKEEEGELFPQLSRTKLDWDALCDEMNSRRTELTEQLMPEQAAEEDETASDEEAAETPSAVARKRSTGAQRGSRAGSGARPQASTRTVSEDDEE